MSRRKSLTDNMVAKLKPGPKRLTVSDPELRAHYIRVTPKGAKSYVVVVRDPTNDKQVWATIGSAAVMNIAEARVRARAAIQRIRDGLATPRPQAQRFAFPRRLKKSSSNPRAKGSSARRVCG